MLILQLGQKGKRLAIIALVAACLTTSASAQKPTVPVVPPSGPAATPFRLERFAEDWSAMADRSARTQPWHHLKWIEMGPAIVTLGGDFRLRTERIEAPLFGATGAGPDTYLLRRAMLHADIRISPALRGFVQVSHHRSYGRAAPFPLDRDGFEFQQAFVEFTHVSPFASVGARVGRQATSLPAPPRALPPAPPPARSPRPRSTMPHRPDAGPQAPAPALYQWIAATF